MNKWLMGAMMVVSSWCSGFVLAQSSANVLLGLQKLNTLGQMSASCAPVICPSREAMAGKTLSVKNKASCWASSAPMNF